MDQMAKIVASMFSSVLGALSDIPRVETKIFPMLPDESLKCVRGYGVVNFLVVRHVAVYQSSICVWSMEGVQL